jgi:hypothetical protein
MVRRHMNLTPCLTPVPFPLRERGTVAQAHLFVATLMLIAIPGCGRTRDMPEKVDMRDGMPVMKAMKDMNVADSMLDTMPGGEMARGDSVASMKLLKKKMRQ